MNNWASHILAAIADALFLPVCEHCGRPLLAKPHFSVCNNCLDTLITLEPPLCPRCGLSGVISVANCPDCALLPSPSEGFSNAFALAPYRGLAKSLVLKLKFEGKTHLAKVVAELLLPLAKQVIDDVENTVFVPAPLHRFDMFMRGYNQSALIAKHLSHLVGIPLVVDCLIKKRTTQRQASLSRDERLKNLVGAFEVNKRRQTQIANKTVVFVDDVLTTGATATQAAIALRKAGVADVKVLTLCRAVI